jgi:hypothetical protein
MELRLDRFNRGRISASAAAPAQPARQLSLGRNRRLMVTIVAMVVASATLWTGLIALLSFLLRH